MQRWRGQGSTCPQGRLSFLSRRNPTQTTRSHPWMLTQKQCSFAVKCTILNWSVYWKTRPDDECATETYVCLLKKSILMVDNEIVYLNLRLWLKCKLMIVDCEIVVSWCGNERQIHLVYIYPSISNCCNIIYIFVYCCCWCSNFEAFVLLCLYNHVNIL